MEAFRKYIQEAIETANRKEAELVHSERKDEANLQRIRANVYGICSSVLGVVSKTHTGEGLQKEFMSKLTVLLQNWETSYEKAKKFGDVEKILIEETKLEAMREVQAKFSELCGK